MAQQEFALGDVLSVTTPFLITNMSGMISVMEFMTGQERESDLWTVYTKQPCAESLLRQFPQLQSVQTPDKFEGKEHVEQWLTAQESFYGKSLSVRTLADA